MGLGVGHDLTILGVGSNKVHVVALANFEDVVLSVIGGIVGAANTVVLVLAVQVGVGACRVADLHAELPSTEEAIGFCQRQSRREQGCHLQMPADNLGGATVTERIREDETTNRVATLNDIPSVTEQAWPIQVSLTRSSPKGSISPP